MRINICVTNNAVTQAVVEGITYVYSFAGIDSTKLCGQAHLKSFRYNTNNNSWEVIGDLPDPSGGVVAAGASTINNKIYIVGGYHIGNDCSEVSSKTLTRYDPETNEYTVLTDIPIAIDDHVQAVYNDSLLYIITGWSNFTNVLQVQIYNPSTDSWTMGTPVPNSPDWRVFGASGSIINNTIYYNGGASLTCNSTSCFAPTNFLRKGIIDPNDPTQIDWTETITDEAIGYRLASTTSHNNFIWLGGSDLTYNFDGIDYNGTGGVEPNGQFSVLNLAEGILSKSYDEVPRIMDLRGIAKIDENNFIICGGMEEGQLVTNKTYKLTVTGLTSSVEETNLDFNVFPNPSASKIQLSMDCDNCSYSIHNSESKMILQGKLGENSINVEHLESGVYFIRLKQKKLPIAVKKFVKM